MLYLLQRNGIRAVVIDLVGPPQWQNIKHSEAKLD